MEGESFPETFFTTAYLAHRGGLGECGGGPPLASVQSRSCRYPRAPGRYRQEVGTDPPGTHPNHLRNGGGPGALGVCRGQSLSRIGWMMGERNSRSA